MKLFCCILVIVGWVCSTEAYEKYYYEIKPSHYNVSLNVHPLERWSSVIQDKKDLMRWASETFIKKLVPEKYLKIIEFISFELDNFFPKEYSDEMKGIAHYSGLPLGEIVLMNLFYEATAYCTSISAVDVHNNIWHARNFDYGSEYSGTKLLQNMTILINFVKNNEVYYKSVSQVGYIGIHTGVGHGRFSLTINERDQGGWIQNLDSAIYNILHGRGLTSIGLVIRLGFEECPDFTAALTYFSKVPLIADAYFTVSGLHNDEGAIVTRSRFETVDVHRISQSEWYVLETNYDRWTTPPPHDDRRDPAIKAMNAMGQKNISCPALMKVLQTPPVTNRGTVFSIVMSAFNSSIFELVFP